MSRAVQQLFRIPSGDGAAKVRVRLEQFLAALPTDRPYDISVAEHKPRRSVEQNRYLWGVVYAGILAAGGDALAGWTAEDLHEYCLGECFGWEEHSALGRRRLRPVRRSSALNKQEFTDYIEFIRAKMAEHGIVVPESEQ